MSAVRHNISFPIPDDIQIQIGEVFKALNSKYNNSYFRTGNWRPHTSIITTLVEEANSDKYLNRVEEIAKEIKTFELKLDLMLSNPEQRYIWINYDLESTKRLKELHYMFQEKLEDLRDKELSNHYQQSWSRLPDFLKKRIYQTGGTHDFYPHISIVKLEPRETRKAILDINRSQFKGVAFTVDKLEIIKERPETPEDMFPIVKQIPLL